MSTQRLSVRVIQKYIEAENIAVFVLEAEDQQQPLPTFSAGAHIEVFLPNGLIKHYSLCGLPNDLHQYTIGVLKAQPSQGGSEYMHDAIQVGSLLSISAPKNNFQLQENDTTPPVFFAAGIGITPIYSMAVRQQQLNKKFTLHFSARSRQHCAFYTAIQSMSETQSVTFYFDDQQQRLSIRDTLSQTLVNTPLYICGPQRYIEEVSQTAQELGWQSKNIHFEYFGIEKFTDSTQDTSFDVIVASTGHKIHVPSGVTIVQALKDAGIDVLTSCEEGVCGTCLTEVQQGIPAHRDVYLTDEEKAANNQMLICCSRAQTAELVLNIT